MSNPIPENKQYAAELNSPTSQPLVAAEKDVESIKEMITDITVTVLQMNETMKEKNKKTEEFVYSLMTTVSNLVDKMKHSQTQFKELEEKLNRLYKLNFAFIIYIVFDFFVSK